MNARRRLQILSACALALGVALLLDLRAEAPRMDAQRTLEREARLARAARDKTRGRLSRADFARLLASVPRDAQQEGVRSDAQHPHPITSEHARLYRDVDLLHTADEAIKNGAYDAARELLLSHHRELGNMSSVEEEGLLLLADCAEEPSESNIARVRSFYDEHSESTVRRRLRRGCLELPALRD